MNFLEQLVAEWFEYRGYFVRTNVKARKRTKGGWDAELDVLAYDPKKAELIHAETSGDSLSWAKRKKHFLSKKFVFTRRQYESLVGSPVSKVRKRAIVGFVRSTKADLRWGRGIEVVLVPTLIREIADVLRTRHPMQQAVPEGYPLLRSFQMVLHYGE